MEELKIGDYVRTRDGFDRLVDKRKDFNHDYYWYRFGSGKTMTNPENGFVIKSSPNILDLIEVGDIIKAKTDVKYYEVIDKHNEYLSVIDDDYVSIEDIEAIITKEQIASMEYKIGDKE